MDRELKERIANAKKRRDFLVHHFWRERSEEFATSHGRLKMVKELNRDAEDFELLNDDINEAVKPVREALGIKDEVLDAYTNQFIAEVKSRDRPK